MEMTARFSGVSDTDCLTAPGESPDRLVEPPDSSADRRAAFAGHLGPAPSASPLGEAGTAGHGEHDQQQDGSGQRGPRSRCHVAVTRARPDRFPVPRFPGARHREDPARRRGRWRRVRPRRRTPDPRGAAGRRGPRAGARRPARREPAHRRGRRSGRGRRRRGHAQPAPRRGGAGPSGRPRAGHRVPGHHLGQPLEPRPPGADAAHDDGRPARPAGARRDHLRPRPRPGRHRQRPPADRARRARHQRR